MKLLRRQFLHLAAGIAAVPTLLRVASSLDYPSQPVRLIVTYAPGGTTDTVARQIGPWLSERFAQAFVLESRPSAGTNVGTDAVGAHLPMAIRSSCSIHRPRPMQRFMTSSISILFATLRRSFASSARL